MWLTVNVAGMIVVVRALGVDGIKSVNACSRPPADGQQNKRMPPSSSPTDCITIASMAVLVATLEDIDRRLWKSDICHFEPNYESYFANL